MFSTKLIKSFVYEPSVVKGSQQNFILFSLFSFLENTLKRVESSLIFAFNKASSSVEFFLFLAADLGLLPLRQDLLVTSVLDTPLGLFPFVLIRKHGG